MSKIAKSVIGLMMITLLGKILGFGRELVLASAYGTSVYSDAYLTSMNIPLVLFSSIGAALGTTFIPMYFEIYKDKGKQESLRFTNNVFNIMILLCVLISILSILFTEQLVNIFAIGFKGEVLEIAIKFTRIQIIGIVFIALMYMMTSYLQIQNNFIIPGLVSVPKNIITIVSILMSINLGPYVMVWGTLLGTVSQFLLQVPYAIKYGYKYKPYINVKDIYIKKMILLLAPVFIGVAVNQINAMVDRTLASTLAEGSISALNYGNKLNQFVMGLFIVSIASVIYPTLAKLASKDNKEQFTKTITTSINTIILVVIPISIGAIVLAKPIVKVLFERGAFDENATSMTAIALAMYAIGMTSAGIRDMLGKVFYSLKDTKTPMTNGAIAMIMNIILNLIFVKSMGIAGLAFATSISSIICIFLLFNSLNKKIGYFGQNEIVKVLLKSIISGIIMAIVTNTMYRYLSSMMLSGKLSYIVVLVTSIVTGALVYGISINILKVKEVSEITNMIKGKIKNR